MDQTLSLVMFSGTDDKLNAAAVLTAGAAAIGRPVHLFLQYWALDAFRADRIADDHGLAPEAGAEGMRATTALRAAGQAPWHETMRQASVEARCKVRPVSASVVRAQARRATSRAVGNSFMQSPWRRPPTGTG